MMAFILERLASHPYIVIIVFYLIWFVQIDTGIIELYRDLKEHFRKKEWWEQ